VRQFLQFLCILHFHTFCIFTHFALSCISCFQIPCAFCDPTHFTFCILAYLARFMFSHISHFAFFALWHALLRASLGSIAFHLHVLSSSSKVHWCIFHFVSLALHHICLYIPIYVHLSCYVFILHHPCTFSTTYSAPSPGNSLSMLICQRIVGGLMALLF